MLGEGVGWRVSQAPPSWGYGEQCVWDRTSAGCVWRAVIGGGGERGEVEEDDDVAQFSLLYQHVPATAQITTHTVTHTHTHTILSCNFRSLLTSFKALDMTA